MCRVRIFVVLTLLSLTTALGPIVYYEREEGDQLLYSASDNITSATPEFISVMFEWLGGNETFTQLYIKTNTPATAVLLTPAIGWPGFKREFTLRVYSTTTELIVNLFVYGFANQYEDNIRRTMHNKESIVDQKGYIQTTLDNQNIITLNEMDSS